MMLWNWKALPWAYGKGRPILMFPSESLIVSRSSKNVSCSYESLNSVFYWCKNASNTRLLYVGFGELKSTLKPGGTGFILFSMPSISQNATVWGFVYHGAVPHRKENVYQLRAHISADTNKEKQRRTRNEPNKEGAARTKWQWHHYYSLCRKSVFQYMNDDARGC